MQFARVDRQNVRVDGTDIIQALTYMPPPVAGILHRACRDCHTEQTAWPWYSHVASMLCLTASNVNAGRGPHESIQIGTILPG